MRRLAVAVGVLVAMLGGGAVANASIPSATGVINGCHKTSGWDKGLLIVIDQDAGESCPSDFTPLSWNHVSGIETVRKTESVAAGTASAVSLPCPSGRRVMGGGYELPTAVSPDVHVVSSTSPSPDGWQVTIRNDSTASVAVEVTANCAIFG